MCSRCARSSSPRAARPRSRVTTPAGLPQPALQQHHQLGHRAAKGRSNMSMRKPLAGHRPGVVVRRRRGARSKPRTSASRSRKPTSRPGTSRSCPTAPTCRPAAARPAQGAKIYAEKCVACHAEGGKGGGAARRRTPGRRRAAHRRHRHVEDHRQLLRLCRPPSSTTSGAPCPTTRRVRSTDNEVYALTAYILALNKLIGENDAMDAKTLPQVKMPNRDNFIMPYPDRI